MTSSRASRFPANPANAELGVNDDAMCSALNNLNLSPGIDCGPSVLRQLALP